MLYRVITEGSGVPPGSLYLYMADRAFTFEYKPQPGLPFLNQQLIGGGGERCPISISGRPYNSMGLRPISVSLPSFETVIYTGDRDELRFGTNPHLFGFAGAGAAVPLRPNSDAMQ